MATLVPWFPIWAGKRKERRKTKKKISMVYLLASTPPARFLEPAVVGHVGVHPELSWQAGNLAWSSTAQPEVHVDTSSASCWDEVGVP